MMKSEKARLILFLVILTVLISPWRNSSPQDDGAYVYSAISLAEGTGVRHAGTIAMNFPQFLLGTVALKVLPTLPKIALLNFISWIVFISSVLLFYFFSEIRWTVIVAFFSFPIWIQYGAIYHGEIYSAFFFVLLMVFLTTNHRVNPAIIRNSIATILSFLLGSQLQNMAAFPFFWGLFLTLEKEREKRMLGISLIAGSVASVIAFGLMPKTPFQTAYSYWLMKMWTDHGIQMPFDFVLSLIQMGVGIGLYLFPLFQWRNRSAQSWIALFATYALIYFIIGDFGIPLMSAGVLFIDYLPRYLTIGLLSLGVGGWWGAWPLLKNIREDKTGIPVVGTLAALAMVWVFSTFRFALDLRYMMTWSLPLLFHSRQRLSRPIAIFGNSTIFIGSLLIVSLVANLYLLNTTDARWTAAAELEKNGVAQTEIAAGYGWNVYSIASQCMYRTVEKLQHELGPAAWTSQEFYRRFLSQYGRAYEDEWVPRFIVKPSKMMGVKLNLTRFRLPGQDSEPVRYIDYTVLGLPNQLAVFENANPQTAWCFR